MTKKKPEKTDKDPHPNQWTPETPMQKKAWELYVDPKSKTFSNAYRSAVEAGYGKEYAEKITTKSWWSEKVRRLSMLSKAEKHLDEMIDMSHIVPAMGPFGPIVEKKTKKPIMVISGTILKEKNKVAMFVAETVGKDKGYSKRHELTGPNGGPVEIDPKVKEKIDKILDDN